MKKLEKIPKCEGVSLETKAKTLHMMVFLLLYIDMKAEEKCRKLRGGKSIHVERGVQTEL